MRGSRLVNYWFEFIHVQIETLCRWKKALSVLDYLKTRTDMVQLINQVIREHAIKKTTYIYRIISKCQQVCWSNAFQTHGVTRIICCDATVVTWKIKKIYWRMLVWPAYLHEEDEKFVYTLRKGVLFLQIEMPQLWGVRSDD